MGSALAGQVKESTAGKACCAFLFYQGSQGFVVRASKHEQ